MKSFILPLFLLGSLALAQKETNIVEIELGKPFLLSVTIYQDTSGMNTSGSDIGLFEDFEFTVSSIEDSRCPEGEGDVVIACYWPGEARVGVSLEKGETFELVIPKQGETVEDTVVFDGYKLTLLDVTPYPKSEEPDIMDKTVHLLLVKAP
jgi:hypothetical protein